MDLEEIASNPAFWILAGGGVIMELIGYIISRKAESLPAFPVWQFLILIVGTIIIAAIFASRG